MRSRAVLLLVPLWSFTSEGNAEAHIALVDPAPRVVAQKIGPCGSGESVRGSALTFAPGETITVTWDETVEHPGHYRIAFDLDGNDDFPLPNNPDDDFPSVLVDQIADRPGGGEYSQEITFPDEECDNCTLQLIQIMTTNVPYNSFYFQCADIVLSYGEGDGPDAGSGDGTGDATGNGAPASGGCSSSGSHTGAAGLALLAMAYAVIRRRRFPPQHP